MNESDQLSSLATHLYVRLRRDGGRVIDVIWLMRNQDYAREILRVARGIPEPELEKLCDRIEELMFGGGKPATAPRPAPTPAPRAAGLQSTEPVTEAQLSATGRYRGGLR